MISVDDIDSAIAQAQELDLEMLLVKCRATIHELAHIGQKNTERAIAAEFDLEFHGELICALEQIANIDAINLLDTITIAQEALRWKELNA